MSQLRKLSRLASHVPHAVSHFSHRLAAHLIRVTPEGRWPHFPVKLALCRVLGTERGQSVAKAVVACPGSPSEERKASAFRAARPPERTSYQKPTVGCEAAVFVNGKPMAG